MLDPYRDWLGITDERRPPTLYQLLGVHPNEADARAIESAVARQLSKVQVHLTGAQSKQAWQIIDEITLAKTTLLDPTKRAAYNSIFGIPAPKQTTMSGPPPVAAPIAPGAGWGRPEEPPVVVQQKSPPRAVQPASPAMAAPSPARQQAAPAPVAYQQPVAPPPPAAKAFNPIVDADETPSSGEFPSVDIVKKSRPKGGNAPILLIGGGILAIGLVGGIVFLATKGKSPTSEPEKTTDVATENHDEKQGPTLAKHDPPKDPPKKNVQPKPKDTKPKIQPKPDLPPRVDPDIEFKQAKLYSGHTATPHLAVAPDGKQVLSVGNDGAVFSWLPGTDKPSRRKSLTEPGVAVAFLADGKDAVIANAGNLYIIDLANNSEKKKLVPNSGSFLAIAVGPDGQHFVTSSSDGVLRWWNASGTVPEKMIDASKGVPIDCVALTPDGKYAIAGNRGDGIVSIWNIANGTQYKQWKAHGMDVTSVACSPDGKRIVTTGADNLAKVWDFGTASLLFTLKGHTDVPIASSFSVDGTMILTTGVDMTIRSWDAVNGDLLPWSFKAENKFFSLALDPKNRFLVAGLGDGGLQMLFLPIVRPDSAPKVTWVQAPKSPMAPPGANTIQIALKSVRDKYANDFVQTDPVEQAALFEKLFKRARLAPEESSARYALFLEARDLAVKLDKPADAFKAIEARALWFDTDVLEEKAITLRSAAQGAVNKTLVEAAITLVEEAERQVRHDIVDELLRINELFPQSDNAPQLVARIQAAKKRWAGAAADREANLKLATELNQDPENPKTNLEYGKYLCFRVGEWADGLPKLAKGEDAALRNLARKEAADPKDGKSQLEMGQTWLDYAAKADDQMKPGILARAKYWYEKAATNLPAAEKLPAAQKVAEVNKQIAVLGSISLARPGEPVTRKNFNTIRSNTAVENQWVLTGSDGYTPDGLTMKADASLSSRFKMFDRCRIDFWLIPDGRPIKVNLNGLDAEFKADADTSTLQLTIERKGDEILISLKSHSGTVLQEKSQKIAAAQQPSLVKLTFPGPGGADGIKIKSIVVNGPVKP